LFATPYADGSRIRFFFSTAALPQLLFAYIGDRKSSYGQHTSQGLDGLSDPGNDQPKKVVVEFSSPNIGKEFNGNHLRSTFTGAFVSNIYACMGWDVIRLNYLGDWGKELALLAIGFKRFGSEETLQSDPLGHMLDVFTKVRELIQPELDEHKRAKDKGDSTAEIEATGLFAERDAFFKSLEAGDEEAMALWQKFRDLSIEHLRKSYDRLGIKFDEYSGESRVSPETMAEVEAALKEEGVLEEEDGSWVINFEKHCGKDGKGLGKHAIRSRNGSTTYLLRDIAAALDRQRAHSFDKMIYVVSFRQDMHFQQVFLALKLMKRGDLTDKLHHVSFGEVQGMTTHVQKPLLLGNILDSYGALAEDAATAPVADGSDKPTPEIRDAMALSGLLSQDMSCKKRAQAYTSSPDRVTTVQGDSGLQLQSVYHQLGSTITQLGTDDVMAAPLDFSALDDDSTIELLNTLARYPETTAAAFKSLEPHTVFAYLSMLTAALADHLADSVEESTAPDGEAEAGPAPAEDGPDEEAKEEEAPGAKRAKLELYRCARQVLENGMRVLGFPVLGKDDG
jgi:arginyl-tRNA synthetase